MDQQLDDTNAPGMAARDGSAVDPVFEWEQSHLREVYAKLVELEGAAAKRLGENLSEVQRFKNDMGEELSQDFDQSDITMETYAAYAVMNNVVDSFNISVDIDAENLARIRRLLSRPYFAKVSLKFPDKPDVRDIYLGAVGVHDEAHRQIVVDWRSPVAETYYNQKTGPMRYWANGHWVDVDLKLRRQFDVDRDRLKNYFDTTVAISDPMLLASLQASRGATMQSITATIQAEQNVVIRHEDVPCLLVRGIAGSGKTSVMLQRIAYLLFRRRESLRAEHVVLITPNPVFERYIWGVLPELGEKNPKTLRWDELMARLGPGDRGLGADIDPAALRAIDAAIASGMALEQSDVREIKVEGHVMLTAQQVWKTLEKFARKVGVGPRLFALAEDDLLEKLDRRVDRLAASEKLRDETLLLDADVQERVFGHIIDPLTDEELAECARTYASDLAATARELVETGAWMRLDRIGMRLLDTTSLTATEWLYLKVALMGKVDASARFVMIDEVQDYSVSQLMVLSRYFSRAHFLLLGDPNQSIREGTATFDEVRELFGRTCGGVTEVALNTSYRSSPEITALFASMLPTEESIHISSVQRPGVAPRIVECPDPDDAAFYLDELVRHIRSSVEACRAGGGLTAVVVIGRGRMHWLAKRLAELMGDDAPRVVEKGGRLPDGGAVLIELALAKGLEFDSVVVADAQQAELGSDELARRRLYTAVSRATRMVTVLSQGPMCELLKDGGR